MNFIKPPLLFALIVYAIFLIPAQAHAAVLTLTADGGVVWKVLSSESEITLVPPERTSLEVKNIVDATPPPEDTVIMLEKNDGKLSLKVTGGNTPREIDVTDINQDIIEIEQGNEPQKIKILASGEDFVISQKGVFAQTSYPIQINPKSHELSVQTPSGLRYIAVLPHEAVENAVKANVLNVLSSGGKIILSEDQKGELEYTITGERVVNILKLIEFTVPVDTSVSASNGRILEINQPVWFSLIGFLFT